METEIKFFSEGEIISGTICLPGNLVGRVPAVALFHGYGSFRDDLTGFKELAMVLAEQGIASVRFDFRGCGSSGNPGCIHPNNEWIEDAHAALSFLEELPEVDPMRLAVAGISVGGGIAVQVAALDERVRCAVALAPVADGAWWLKHLWTSTRGEEGWLNFLQRLSSDRRKRAEKGYSQKVAIEEILAYGPEDTAAREYMLKKYPQFATHAYLSSADSLLQFQPRQFVHLITPRPFRIIHSLTDKSVPIEHAYELFGRAGPLRDLMIIPDSPHAFWLGKYNKDVQELTLDWIQRYV
jgi:dipeptidyl aminopeptidase/acylaminoacyl peptidase